MWNGEDIKHKVLQKLNSKTNAAGWVPTGFNRTAGSFAQPGGSGQSGSSKGPNLHMASSLVFKRNLIPADNIGRNDKCASYQPI